MSGHVSPGRRARPAAAAGRLRQHVRARRQLQVRVRRARGRDLRLGLGHLRQRRAHNLPSQRHLGPSETAARPAATASAPAPAADRSRPSSGSKAGTPAAKAASGLRSQARVLRLWTKPWEDADGDLSTRATSTCRSMPGRWQIDHVRQRIRDQYAPLRPPPAPHPGPAATDAGRSGNRRVPQPLRYSALSPFARDVPVTAPSRRLRLHSPVRPPCAFPPPNDVHAARQAGRRCSLSAFQLDTPAEQFAAGCPTPPTWPTRRSS
jgi:hypothetical protein